MTLMIRDATAADFEAIVELNAVEVRQTSPMDLQKLCWLDRLASEHKVATVDGKVAAFLLAMENGADYPNENYGWFAACFPRFLYVDRIVVGTGFSRQGIARRLYEELFARTRLNAIPSIVCEYNIEPPNLASRAFHDEFGFQEIGTQWLAKGTKRVSLQAASTERVAQSG